MIRLKYILLLSFISLSILSKAQQDPHFTQFMFNNLIYNPAVAGSEHDMEVTFFHRKQWVAMPMSPITQTLTAHMPISRAHQIGGGLQVVNDKIGFERHLSVIGSGSYHIRFLQGSNKINKLFMGMQFGFKQYRLDAGELNPYDGTDQVLPTLTQSTMLPEIGIGFLFKAERYYAGVSVPHLIQSKIKYTDYQMLNARMVRHYYFTAGYDYNVDPEWKIKPNVNVKAVLHAPVELDVNTLVEYKEMAWAGLSYRTGDAIAFLLGVNAGKLSDKFKEPIRIGYAFDFTANRIPKYNKGTHEIMLTYTIGREKIIRAKFDTN